MWPISRGCGEQSLGLSVRPGYVLSDGFRVPGLAVPSLPVVGGDAAAACIAAASVLAKVSRDRLMVKMEAEHPGYGFAEHKGYSTPGARRRAGRARAVQPAPVFVHQRPPRGHADRHQGGDGARGRLRTGAARRSWVREDECQTDTKDC